VVVQQLQPIPEDEATIALSSDDPYTIADAIYRLGIHDEDWQWVTEQVVRFVDHPSHVVRHAVATALGELAMLNGVINRDLAGPVLEKLTGDADQEVAMAARDAIADVEQWAPAEIDESPPSAAD
jgi:hypothetical protein